MLNVLTENDSFFFTAGHAKYVASLNNLFSDLFRP